MGKQLEQNIRKNAVRESVTAEEKSNESNSLNFPLRRQDIKRSRV